MGLASRACSREKDASRASGAKHVNTRQPKVLTRKSRCLWGGPEGVINFPWIFFMQYRVKSLLGTFGIYPGTYSLGLFAGLFSDAVGYCLPIVIV